MAYMALVDRGPFECTFVRHAYWRWLLRPWKLVTFGVVAAALIVLGSSSHHPGWDPVVAAITAVLTFLTAPYAVGTFYRRLLGIGGTWDHAALSVCLWFLSTTWFSDLYLLWRDGHYAATWYGDLVASSIFYCCAGLFWSLDWRRGTRTTIAFTAPYWPSPEAARAFRPR